MHLKSLTLKGFKSFASATTLRLEPGITCVVGPNGSGKSNVVDAISWVLGEQGAKALRGGKMEDVIFAGTSGRAPLGRAEVTLTIDNSDGALPIDYAEVSITRRMFRDGAGEYEINGSHCRLLDIQELLSDSGIGREMHVIVGQGQLDSVLSSKPEDRRAYIEEAAGVLKHRKRKEKALRKLDAMQANLTRLTDLTAELRRQLKPLGRQAEIARRAQAVQSELRDARLRLAADDLVTLRDELAKEEADEASARARRAEVEAQLSAGRVEQERLEAALAEDAPRLAAAQDTWYRLSALAERLAGTVRLAQERARHLAGAAEARAPGRDPDELDAEADAIAEQEEALVAAVVEARRALLGDHRGAHRARTHAGRGRAGAPGRRPRARRPPRRARDARAAAPRRCAAAPRPRRRRSSGCPTRSPRRRSAPRPPRPTWRAPARSSAPSPTATPRWRSAARTRGRATRPRAARVAELVAQEREAEQQRAHWRARVEALSVGLARRDGSAALVGGRGRAGHGVGAGHGGGRSPHRGRRGAGRAGRRPRRGRPRRRRRGALGALRARERRPAAACPSCGGRARARTTGRRRPLRLPDVPGAERGGRRRRWPGTGPSRLRCGRCCTASCSSTDREAARRVVAAGLTAVTADGDVARPAPGVRRLRGGGSALDVQAAVDDATTALGARSRSEIAGLRPALDGARAEEAARQADVEAAQREQGAAEQRRAGAAARLGRLRAGRPVGRRPRPSACAPAATRSRPAAPTRCSPWRPRSSSSRWPRTSRWPTSPTPRSATPPPRPSRPPAPRRSRPAWRCAPPRSGRGRSRAAPTPCAARPPPNARPAAARPRPARPGSGAPRIAALSSTAGETACGRIAVSLAAAAEERDAAAAARDSRERELGEARLVVGRLTRADGEAHRRRAPRRGAPRPEPPAARAAHREGARRPRPRRATTWSPSTGRTCRCPPRPRRWPSTRRRGSAARTSRRRPRCPTTGPPSSAGRSRAEKDLALLGKVNPLALEEFAALEERYRFLSTQLEDLKNTRRDLLTVVREVDDKILEVFTEAYADVAREFVTVFATLFPGGEGRLVLTDPEDMLTTGIEVEARPPGKKVKRLSLLSGGERSLTAMALLVAIFRARPSPFYVLDEIEAALDDVNLRRLIPLMEELRETSQLIVITHQKPTMEVADALYGVSMRGDGITTVISQRLRPAS